MDHIRNVSEPKRRLTCEDTHGPIQQSGTCASCAEPDLWVSGPGSTRYIEPIPPEYSAVRDCWHSSGLRYDLCCSAGLARDAQASLKCGHAPKDGGYHGGLSDSLGLLRFVDRFSTRDCMERDRGVDQFVERRRVPPFRPHRKGQARKLASYKASIIFCWGWCRLPMDQETST